MPARSKAVTTVQRVGSIIAWSKGARSRLGLRRPAVGDGPGLPGKWGVVIFLSRADVGTRQMPQLVHGDTRHDLCRLRRAVSGIGSDRHRPQQQRCERNRCPPPSYGTADTSPPTPAAP